MTDSHNLQRFVDAQDPVYEEVLAELANGQKTSHWIWFVFPQHKELGRSAMAQHYGIASKEEAHTYWQHPVLGARLRQCVELVLAVKGKTVFQIFGTPDDLKFGSSMTLFSKVAPDEPLFQRALAMYFGGIGDFRTLELLG